MIHSTLDSNLIVNLSSHSIFEGVPKCIMGK